MQGLPPLMLSVGDHMETWRWKFAFLNSYRYASYPLEHFDLYKHRNEMSSMFLEMCSEQLRKIIAHAEAKQIQLMQAHKKTLTNTSTSTSIGSSSNTARSAAASADGTSTHSTSTNSREESPSLKMLKSLSVREVKDVDSSVPPPPPRSRMMARVASIGSLDTSTS